MAYAAFIACYPFGLEDLENEIWADIEGYDGDYQESNYGRTKSLKFGKAKILRPLMNQQGYLFVILYKNNEPQPFRINRLVAKYFIPNPNNLPVINHKDGIKFNNYFENLERCTDIQNKQHAFKTGLQKSGADHRDSKLTEENVRFIGKYHIPYDKKFGVAALAEKFNVHPKIIWNVVNFKTYKNVK